MAFTTANDLINEMFATVGITAEGEVPTAAQANAALLTVNMMIDTWAANRISALALTRESFPLTANVYSYLIGSGQTFNTSVPGDIKGAFYQDGNNNRLPVRVLTREEYDSLPDAIISTGPPKAIFFDPGATQQTTFKGTIYVYPVPDGATPYNLYLESQKPFTEFASLVTAYSFPPSYQEAMVYNGAIRIAAKNSVPVSALVAEIARESLSTLVALNSKRMVAGSDVPGGSEPAGHGMNILSGDLYV